jgi:hypothetical protein
VAITYTWAMCLLTQLPRFLDLIEAELERVLERKPRCRWTAPERGREFIFNQSMATMPYHKQPWSILGSL